MTVLDASAVLAFVQGYDLELVPDTHQDAELAARLWKRGSGLSLGDRLCLALAERLDVEAVTADVAWGTSHRVVQVALARLCGAARSRLRTRG